MGESLTLDGRDRRLDLRGSGWRLQMICAADARVTATGEHHGKAPSLLRGHCRSVDREDLIAVISG